jgi:MerR family transcriptional regulator, copper efflux regulator
VEVGWAKRWRGAVPAGWRAFSSRSGFPQTLYCPRSWTGVSLGRVAVVRNARTPGSLAQVGEILAIRDNGHPPCAHVADLVDNRLLRRTSDA